MHERLLKTNAMEQSGSFYLADWYKSSGKSSEEIARSIIDLATQSRTKNMFNIFNIII